MREIRGTTKIAAVLGWPVEHTRSPVMLNAAFTADEVARSRQHPLLEVIEAREAALSVAE